MYYTLLNELNNKSISYKLDVINDGFVIRLNYRNKLITVYYNNYNSTRVNINDECYNDIISSLKTFFSGVNYDISFVYNFNDINDIIRMIDDLYYYKKLKLKIIYLKRYLDRLNENMDYLILMILRN